LDICRELAYTGDLSLTLEPSRNKSDMIVAFVEKTKHHEKKFKLIKQKNKRGGS
jgi:hypothetical protein